MLPFSALLLATSGLGAQTPTPVPQPSTPEAAAGAFQDAVERLDWTRLIETLHPRALETFRMHVSILLEHDVDGAFRRALVGPVSDAAWEAMDPRSAVRRVLGRLATESPGLAHAHADRRHEILGSVREGAIRAHVVYRVRPALPGATPEVRVMSLARTGDDPGGWAVVESPELDGFHTALRGLPLAPAVPPGE